MIPDLGDHHQAAQSLRGMTLKLPTRTDHAGQSLVHRPVRLVGEAEPNLSRRLTRAAKTIFFSARRVEGVQQRGEILRPILAVGIHDNNGRCRAPTMHQFWYTYTSPMAMAR